MRNFVKPLTAAYLAMGIIPAFAENHIDASTVVAIVNGTEITLGHVILVREGLPAQYQSLHDDRLFRSIIEQLIQQTLLSQDRNATDTLRTQLTIDNNLRMMRASEAVDLISSQEIGEEDIVAAYQAKFVDAQAEREFNASHILVETEESAIDLIERVKAGVDFAELAKELSTGPSGPNGGQLGWFQKGIMVAPFEETVMAMQTGAISGPVKTDFGWHVIKLNNVRDLPVQPLEQVRDEIFAQLQQQAVLERIGQLQETGDIVRTEFGELNPGLLRDLTLLDK